MAGKKVKFCISCSKETSCNSCDEMFNRNRKLQSTSFFQFHEDITTFYTKSGTDMITDIGCPSSVIGEADVERFIENLSQFQQDNLERLDVDEKFKFGPSGPYPCAYKLKIPIKTEEGTLFVTVAIVKANIPMLLGNNILKPLGAEIKLLKAGNGILKLNDVEIKLRETRGGHYTIKVGDLGKLNVSTPSRRRLYQTSDCCEVCDNVTMEDEALRKHKEIDHGSNNHCYECGYSMRSSSDLKKHKETIHGPKERKLKSALKNRSTSNEVENRSNHSDKVVTDLNTLINGKPSKRELKMINIMKEISYLKHCSECETDFEDKSKVRCHVKVNHEISAGLQNNCSECELNLGNVNQVKNHKNDDHEVTATDTSEVGLVFLSHHQEESCEDAIVLNPDIWEAFEMETDQDDLTDEEKKEILKLHKYFAHRNGAKLWEN